MKLKIFLNKTYCHTCNLIDIIINCKYFNLAQYKDKKTLYIDNVAICSDDINSIEFITNGYNNIIDVNSHHSLFTSNKEYTKQLKAKNAFDLNKIIMEV